MAGTRILRQRIVLLSTLAALTLPASAAFALDPQPKTYREKQRHEFRDVQLGLSHPAPHGRSTLTNAAGRNDMNGNKDSTSMAAQDSRPPVDQSPLRGASQ
ncbi:MULTISPECIES: hypothetical protein [Xanthobacter]|uniref:hypothetical protein n=1 Tax=Xanthobacter TaxID=279 RepID=UPI001EDCF7E2|nr:MULTISPECIES: hypothetical protein [unclassified Xanthobacter]